MEEMACILEQGLLSEVHPLPLRLLPLPWEDVASFISRNAERMGYEYPLWILRPEAIPYCIESEGLSILRKKRDYEFLKRLLCIDEQTLYNLTFHRFASLTQLPEFIRCNKEEEISRPLITSTNMSKLTQCRSATKICPACLEEEPAYGRSYWNIKFVVSCLKHRNFLVQQCPECQRAIPLFRPSLVSCPFCKKGDYRRIVPCNLPNDPYFAAGQSWILKQLSVENEELEGIAEEILSPFLRELPSPQYFRLFEAFHALLNPLFPNHPFLRTAIVDSFRTSRSLNKGTRNLLLGEWTTFISTFHFIFDSWPSHFFTLLNNLIDVKREKGGTGGVVGYYGSFYEKWLYSRLKGPNFTFLREAFEDYMKRLYRGGVVTNRLRAFHNTKMEIRQERNYLTLEQVTEILEIGETMVWNLVNNGNLRVQKIAGGKSGKVFCTFFEKEDVEEFLCRWKNMLQVSTVAQVLGVSEIVVLSLTNAGLLTATRSHFSRYYKCLYKKEDVEHFMDNVLCQAQRKTTLLEECVLLPMACKATRLTYAEIVVEILAGKLKPIDTARDVSLFQRLVFMKCELEQFGKKHNSLGLLKLHEAAKRIGVSYSTLRRWMELGLLEKEYASLYRKKDIFLRKEEVNAFQRKYISSQEISNQLEVEPRTILKCIRLGILHPIDKHKVYEITNIYLLLREEVETQRCVILQMQDRRDQELKALENNSFIISVTDS